MAIKLNHKNPPFWGITRRADGRYVIIDTIARDVLHDGQYGFKSYEAARNYGYYQYKTEPINCVEDSAVKQDSLF